MPNYKTVDFRIRSLLRSGFGDAPGYNRVRGESLDAVLGGASITAKDIGFDGKYVKLHVPKELLFTLERQQFVLANRGKVVGAIRAELQQIMALEILPKVRAAAIEAVRSLVYETPAQLVGKPKGKNYMAYLESKRKFKRIPTGDLLRAVARGITFDGSSFRIGLDEKLAPHWIWVEKGHRVVIRTIRGPIDTGRRILGRPFMEAVFKAAARVIEAEAMPYLIMFAKDMMKSVGEWTLTGRLKRYRPKTSSFKVDRESFIDAYVRGNA